MTGNSNSWVEQKKAFYARVIHAGYQVRLDTLQGGLMVFDLIKKQKQA